MDIQPIGTLYSQQTKFGSRPTTKLPKELRAKPSTKAPKGLLMSIIPIVLFIMGQIFWKQTPEYALQKLTKEYQQEISELKQDSTNQHKIDSLTINFINQSIELMEEINEHDIIKKYQNRNKTPEQQKISADTLTTPPYEPIIPSYEPLRPYSPVLPPYEPRLDTIG